MRFRTVESIHGVSPSAWDACAGDAHPAVSHAFFAALEDSGSAAPRSGWVPRHLVAEEDGTVVGVVPGYRKAHSWGEYVFDHAWADAWQRAGGRYYPKLTVAVPFTPVPGPRLLTRSDAVRAAFPAALVEAARGCSSVHVLFHTGEEHATFGDAGWLDRAGFQFHWKNEGYRTFEDFLAGLSSKRRKEVRRERRSVAASGLRLVDLPGAEVSPELWRTFHGLYLANSSRHWGQPYLAADFYVRLGAAMPDRLLLSCAFDGDTLVAGAIHLVGADALYGRQWGSTVEVPFLHFELCYYRAIEHAIGTGLPRVEAGAQGEHKIQRGYLPSPTYSSHYVADPRLRTAVADFCRRERAEVERVMGIYAEHGPFTAGRRSSDQT